MRISWTATLLLLLSAIGCQSPPLTEAEYLDLLAQQQAFIQAEWIRYGHPNYSLEPLYVDLDSFVRGGVELTGATISRERIADAMSHSGAHLTQAEVLSCDSECSCQIRGDGIHLQLDSVQWRPRGVQMETTLLHRLNPHEPVLCPGGFGLTFRKGRRGWHLGDELIRKFC